MGGLIWLFLCVLIVMVLFVCVVLSFVLLLFNLVCIVLFDLGWGWVRFMCKIVLGELFYLLVILDLIV